jgi:hypothetical protein
MKQKKARMMATILYMFVSGLAHVRKVGEVHQTHNRYGKTTASLKVLAIQIRFSGS